SLALSCLRLSLRSSRILRRCRAGRRSTRGLKVARAAEPQAEHVGSSSGSRSLHCAAMQPRSRFLVRDYHDDRRIVAPRSSAEPRALVASQQTKMRSRGGTADHVTGFLPIKLSIRECPMLKTSIAAGLAGSLLLASAAFAQAPTATSDKADKPEAAASS